MSVSSVFLAVSCCENAPPKGHLTVSLDQEPLLTILKLSPRRYISVFFIFQLGYISIYIYLRFELQVE